MAFRINLPLMITGAAIPSGSYSPLMTDKTPHLVNGFSPMATLKVNVSVPMSQNTPRDLCIGAVSLDRSKSRKADA